MWKNKHFVVALLVAPVLALIAYFATDYFVAERPHAAQSGSSYPLVARSNCRYASGECVLVNGDVKLTLSANQRAGGETLLHLDSAVALGNAMVAVTTGQGDDRPVDLSADDDTATSWSTELGEVIAGQASLRLVVMAGESRYFAEVPTVFFEREATKTR